MMRVRFCFLFAELFLFGERDKMERSRGPKQGSTGEIAFSFSSMWKLLIPFSTQRQTVVSQFFQLDRLVVEGQKTVLAPSQISMAAADRLADMYLQGKQTGDEGGIVRQTTE